MKSDRVIVVALLLASSAALSSAQQPAASARLSGIPRDVACSPESPGVAPGVALKVTGASEPLKKLFGNGDTVIVNGGTAQGVRAGDEFYARRIVDDNFTEPVPGGVKPVSIHTAGMLQIVETKDNVSTAVVTVGCDGIIAGDYLERFQAPALPPGAVGTKPDFSSPGYVILGDDRRQIGGAGEFMVIDRGTRHGVQPGQQVTIFRQATPGDHVNTVGTATVYVARLQSATVRIDRSVDAVYVGDRIAIHR
jgi:hypothetical protein